MSVIFDHENGIWKGAKPPLVDCAVVRNTNFTDDGLFDFTDVAVIPIEQRLLERKHLERGDIVIERSGGGPDQPVGRVAYFDRNDATFCFSNFTSRLRVLERTLIEPEFLHQFLLNFHLSGQTETLQRRTTGIRNLAFQDYLQVEIPVPPIEHQRRMVSILKTLQEARCSRERELKFERERKAALLDFFFTKGLSGEASNEIEVGRVPASWTVLELGELCEIVYGIQAAVANLKDPAKGIPILTNVNITNEGALNLETLRYFPVPDNLRERVILKQGDVLFNWRSGSQSHVGKTAIFQLEGEYTFSSFILRFRPRPIIDNYFLFSYLTEIKSRGFFLKNRQQSSVNSVFNASVASGIPVAFPDLGSQRRIAGILKGLDAIARLRGLPDGFEGNAQSFRIVTKLAMGSTENGLNLTRATLNAILKYPWAYAQNQAKPDKWGCYEDDIQIFSWARQLGPAKNVQSNEARLMDWSDDVTYSVHDVDDFYRAGVIPLDRLVVDSEERERFYTGVFARRKDRLPKDMDELFLRGAFDSLMSVLNVREPYTPTRESRIRLRRVTSTLIRDFVNAVQLDLSANPPQIFIEKRRRAEIFMLKQLTWHYVIKNPALATQQHGQRVIVRQLFNAFYKAGTRSEVNIDFFPISLRELLPPVPTQTSSDRKKLARAIIDFIASLTEEQAIATHHRIYGIKLGSSLVFQVR